MNTINDAEAFIAREAGWAQAFAGHAQPSRATPRAWLLDKLASAAERIVSARKFIEQERGKCQG